MKRREWLAALSGTWLGAGNLAAMSGQRGLGVTLDTFQHRWLSRDGVGDLAGFRDLVDVLDYAREQELRLLQAPVDLGASLDLAAEVRKTLESYDMQLEGIVEMPRHEGELPAFENRLRWCESAGVKQVLVRASKLRHEEWGDEKGFLTWKAHWVRLIEQMLSLSDRAGVRLSLDGLVYGASDETQELLSGRMGEPLGLCLDTWDCLTYLYSPVEVLQVFGANIRSIRWRDAVLGEVPGFGVELAEVPVGKGALDTAEIRDAVQKHCPQAQWIVETRTHDPILIPCLKDEYWQCYPERKARDFVRFLALVKAHSKRSTVLISAMSPRAKLALEAEQFQKSLEAVRGLQKGSGH